MRRIACALVFLPAIVAAETFDFDQAQLFALTHSPAIQAAYSSIGQARGKLLQAGLWPNPEIDLSYRADVFFGGMGQNKAMASLMQRFPWSGRLARAQNLSRVEVAIALTDVRDAERKLILDVQRLFIQARTAAEKQATLKKLTASMDSLIALNEAGLQAGRTSAMAVDLAKVEREGLLQQILSLEADEEAPVETLKGLMGITGRQPLALKGSLEEIISRLKKTTAGTKLYRPDLVRAALETDAATAESALARTEVWEDITVGVEYEYMRTLNGMNLMNGNFLGARVNLPLPVWNRNQGTIGEKSAGRERAGNALTAARLAIGSEIAAARVRAEKTASVASRISKVSLPLLDETRGVLDSAIQNGQADTTDAVTLTNQEINQRLLYVDSLMNHAQALSELEAALGANRFLNRDIFTNTLHDKPASAREPRPPVKKTPRE